MKTLSQVFDPPDGLFGQVCVASALSAGQSFIEEALERFTVRRASSRRLDGCADLFLMLDKGHVALDDSSAVGLVQMPPLGKSIWESKIARMHAKVALMQFGNSRSVQALNWGSDTVWRLVVTTGNWTEVSASQNIEMVWTVDLKANEQELDRQALSDLLASVDFLDSLHYLYVVEPLLWNRAHALFQAIRGFAGNKRLPSTRFVSSLPLIQSLQDVNKKKGTPLLPSILKQFCDNSMRRNWILLGSGFYEQANTSESKPEVLARIERDLLENDKIRSASGFIKSPYRELVLNPQDAGQLSKWGANSEDWVLYLHDDPAKKYRKFLHAKYIFVGNYSDKTELVNRGKLYVGSGNLSIKGILSAYGKKGNIETGIVFDTDDNLPTKMNDLMKTLACGKKWSPDKVHLESGNNNDSNDAPFRDVLPLLSFRAVETVSGSIMLLTPSWISTDQRELIDIGESETVCVLMCPNGNSIMFPLWCEIPFSLSTELTRSVPIKWRNEIYLVPILNQEGLYFAPPVALSGVADLLACLTGFPSSHTDDSNDDDEIDDGIDAESERVTGKHKSVALDVVREVFPYSSCMSLIEGIAELNQRHFEANSGSESFLLDWIRQVRGMLKGLPLHLVQQWQGMGINFLDVLKESGFAPPNEPQAWSDFVTVWAKEWGIANKPSLLQKEFT